MMNLLLVEDHTLFAEVLTQALEKREDLTVVMVVYSAEKALQVIPGLELDLVLVDISLPKMNGIELVRSINQLYPHLQCLMISGHISSLYMRRSLAAGARGYAIKASLKGIIKGIYEVMRGEIYISKELHIP